MGITNTKLWVQYTFTMAMGYNTRGDSIINMFLVHIKTYIGRTETAGVY